MEYRRLGDSGLVVSALAFGTATFGGSTPFFSRWGTTGVPEATRLVDIALDAGVTLFDTADSYSNGIAEDFLGQGILEIAFDGAALLLISRHQPLPVLGRLPTSLA